MGEKAALKARAAFWTGSYSIARDVITVTNHRQAGFVRATEDIDLLVEMSPDNLHRLRRALADLPDQAVEEMADDDLMRYVVVRVADEIVVDLMKAACGVTFDDAKELVDVVTVEGVAIPFASPALLWRTKQTMREKDRLDRMFLATLLGESDP